MASQSAALQLILQAINAMREPATPRSSPPTPGSTSRAAPLGPYAFGHCTECSRLIIGWSAYQ
jgi:hypothetical protein